MRYLAAFFILTLAPDFSHGDGWNTFRHDKTRSGRTGEIISPPLEELWLYNSGHKPAPAWPLPAKQDFWNKHQNLQSAISFDRAYHVVIEGNSVLFGSSTTDKIYCLDSENGRTRWTFFTEGPVRFAPLAASGRVYAASDDGFVYCLSRRNGELLWKKFLPPSNRKIPGNGRMISAWPIRTGLLLEKGTLFCAAGIFPDQGIYIYALKAEDGSTIFRHENKIVSPGGYLLASTNHLFVPTGRTAPAIFDLSSGKYLGETKIQGGSFALVSGDVIAGGPGRTSGVVEVADMKTKERIASFGGLQMVVSNSIAYLLTKTSITALNRIQYIQLARKKNTLSGRAKAIENKLKAAKRGGKKDDAEKLALTLEKIKAQIKEYASRMQSCFLWKTPCGNSLDMILAGDTLYAGGRDTVAAYRATDGKQVWSSPVKGNAYGLAASNGKLFVSTDEGIIHCFGKKTNNVKQTAPVLIKADILKKANPRDVYPAEKIKVYEQTARTIIDSTGIVKGYCIDIGCGKGRLSYEIALLTGLKVIGIESDPGKVAEARRFLDLAGLYGSRVSVIQGSLSKLPFTSCCANLVISSRSIFSPGLPTSRDEIYRVLRPCGGVAYIGHPSKNSKNSGSLFIRRGEIKDSGEWTHLYATCGNTAASGDNLQGPLYVQWFGRPGPRKMIDRHHRAMGSLYKDGRLFIQGNNRIITVDAYNGTLLWETAIPNSRRIAAPRDCGHIAVTSDLIFVAAGEKCSGLDVESGKISFTKKIPQPGPAGHAKHDWGYLSCSGDLLFGTGEKKGASYTGLSRFAVAHGPYYDNEPIVTSEYMFCVDTRSGENSWIYRDKSGGVIANSSITATGSSIFFIESRNRDAILDTDGKIKLELFLKEHVYLVKLDGKNGNKIWEHPLDLPVIRHILFGSCSQGKVFITGASNEKGHPRYDILAFDAATGNPAWTNHYLRMDKGVNGGHGEQDQHPVIIGDIIYSNPYAFNTKTGRREPFDLDRGGHGCGTLSGSSFYLYGRGGNPLMYPLDGGGRKNIPITRVSRPGCWIDIFPVGGMILIPESSSGCTCGYPLQASFGLAPWE